MCAFRDGKTSQKIEILIFGQPGGPTGCPNVVTFYIVGLPCALNKVKLEQVGVDARLNRLRRFFLMKHEDNFVEASV